MKREIISLALNQLDDRHISETAVFAPKAMQEASERKQQMKQYSSKRSTKRFVTIIIAACLVLSLGIVSYASWSIQAARQQGLLDDLNIIESKAESYIEYSVNDEADSKLVLLSTVNDGQEQRVYVNISPVSEDEAAAFPENVRFGWNIEGTELWGHAGPVLPTEMSVSGDEIKTAVLEHAYDRETETMTLLCFVNTDAAKKLSEELGTSELPFVLNMSIGDETKSFGPVPLVLTDEQRRDFDFGPAIYHDKELDKEIEIVGLELTPFSAVWKVAYESAADFHKPNADWDAYQPWSILEEKVCIESEIIFTDGSSFSTGGALTTPYSEGTVNLSCAWGKAIDINAVERIVLGDLVLWEK
ncbi:MAG: hypothetical protein IJ364_07070 [Oscillospiraceae bacterium]|nr:hypothetical protein [Oscillospiraceae bacterium]